MTIVDVDRRPKALQLFFYDDDELMSDSGFIVENLLPHSPFDDRLSFLIFLASINFFQVFFYAQNFFLFKHFFDVINTQF